MWAIIPGNMEATLQACKLFGIENVDPGMWGTPVYVRCSREEAHIFAELLTEHDKRGPFRAAPASPGATRIAERNMFLNAPTAPGHA